MEYFVSYISLLTPTSWRVYRLPLSCKTLTSHRRNESRLFLEIIFTISFRFGARVTGPWKSICRPLIENRFHFMIGILYGKIWPMTSFGPDGNNLSLLRAHIYTNMIFLGNLILMFLIQSEMSKKQTGARRGEAPKWQGWIVGKTSMISLGSSFEARSVQRNASGYERNLIRIRAVQGQRMGLSLPARRYRWDKADWFRPYNGNSRSGSLSTLFRESDSG